MPQIESKEEQTHSMSALAYHELVHLLDGRHDFRLSGGAFQEHYQRLKRNDLAFIRSIDEKEFFEFTFGGHGADNEREFLASFLNSLRHPDWSAKLQESSIYRKRAYLETLEVLEKHLYRVYPEIAQTPMYRSVLEKRQQMQLLLDEASSKR